MSLWEKLCSFKKKKSNCNIDPSRQTITPFLQNPERDIFTDTKFLLKDRLVKYIFDVGANRGDFTSEFVHSFPDAGIHCFEPNPTTCETLKTRFKEYPHIRIHNVAVSNVQGVADFCCNKECATDSLFSPSPEWKEWVDGKSDALLLTTSIQAKTITLDQFCHDQSIEEIDILKIDTQGAELLVLEGASGLLQERAVHVIIAELLFVPVYAGQPYYYEVCSRLAAYGYDLANLYDCRYDDTALQLKWADGVFIRRGWKSPC
jgi:FkbM family methyltransferase